MSPSQPNHFVVDGSNIATEGRSKPSLAQLNEAVLGFMKQFPDAVVTVIVDATFGHRIDAKERKAFDEGVANNELVAPPAGAIGRGDAFVLTIADQSGAGVLSNDSFQEFHGDYPWLFDEGRLIGGKPVPNVGWVFVPRTPVRGPKSRESTRSSRRKKVSADELQDAKRQAASRVRKRGDGEDDAPSPERGSATSGRRRAPKNAVATTKTAAPLAAASGSPTYVNELMPFIDFVEHHPVGAEVAASVDRYSSHGSYLVAEGVSLYLPLQNMADPAPTSARSVVAIGDDIRVAVVGFQPERRSVDVALPDMAAKVLGDSADVGGDRAVATTDDQGVDRPEVEPDIVAEPSTTKKRAAKKTAAKKTAAKKASAKKAAAKKTTAKKASAKKAAVKKTTAKKASAKKAAVKKTTAKKASTKKAAAKKTSAKKTPAKKKAATAKAGAKKAAPAKAASAT